jgi:hypothetical protein
MEISISNIKDWWSTCLKTMDIYNLSWNEIKKKDLYMHYRENCSGEPVHSFVFWKEMINYGIPYFENLESLDTYKEKFNIVEENYDNITNWWSVCLYRGKVSGIKWEDLTKKILYNEYKKTCIGQPLSQFMFWMKMSEFGIKIFEDIPNIEECKIFNKKLNFDLSAFETKNKIKD